jgi:hypothetical protein
MNSWRKNKAGGEPPALRIWLKLQEEQIGPAKTASHIDNFAMSVPIFANMQIQVVQS